MAGGIGGTGGDQGSGGASDGGSGIYLSVSTNNTISGNTISRITGGTGGTGGYQGSGGSGGVGSGIYLSGSTNNTISGNTISNMTGGTGGTGGIGSGIYLSDSTNNTISGNTISNMTGGTGGTGGDQGSGGADGVDFGIFLNSDSYQNIIDSINTVDGDPILYYSSISDTIIENYVLTANSNPTNLGKIALVNSNNNIIRNNTISNATGSTNNVVPAINLLFSNYNQLSNNTISNISQGSSDNSVGIYLSISDHNELTENNIKDLEGALKYYIYSNYSNSNDIYHNLFQSLSTGAYDNTGNNNWNSSMSSGNYWSGYSGTDLDNNSIGDTPYDISGGSGVQDHFPVLDIVSGVYHLPEYENPVSFRVNYVIFDPLATGHKEVILYYNSGSGWNSYASSTNGYFDFTVPDGPAKYDFYSLVIDNNDQMELPPATPDTYTYIDTNFPISTLIPFTPDPTNNTAIAYSGFAYDSVTNIARVEYRVDGTNWSNATPIDGAFNSNNELFMISLNSLSDGTHFIEVRSTDSYGNIETTYSNDTITKDSTSPTLIIDPQPTTPTNKTKLNFTGNATDLISNISNIEYRLDSNIWMPATPVDGTLDSPSEPFNFSIQNLTDGIHIIEVRASDSLYNTGQPVSVTLTIDTQPPQASISYPVSGSTTGVNATLVAITNESAIVKYDIVDVPYQQMNYTFINTGSKLHTTILTNLSHGTHTIYVSNSDIAGNTNTSTINITWLVDSSRPQVSQILINNKTTNNINSDPNVKTDITSTFYPIASLEYFIDTIAPDGTGIFLSANNTLNQNLDLTLNITTLPEGPHTIYLHAANQMGWGGYQAAAFTIDITPPVININSPANASIITDTTPQVSFTITDTSGTGINISSILVNSSPSGLGFDPSTDCAVSGTGVACAFTVDTPYPDPSTNTLILDAVDNTGNLAIQTETVFGVNSSYVDLSSAVFVEDGYASNGKNITIPIWINVTESSGVGSATIDFTADPQVLNSISVDSSDFDAFSSNFDEINGTVRMAAYQTGATGMGPGIINFANVQVQVVGNYSDFSSMNLDVVTFKNNTGIVIPYHVINGIFVVSGSGDFSGDGTTDAWDITYLARSVAGIPGYETLHSADVSGDDTVDVWDCTYLARAIAGISGYNI